MRDTGYLLGQANLVLFDLDGTLLDSDTATAVSHVESLAPDDGGAAEH